MKYNIKIEIDLPKEDIHFSLPKLLNEIKEQCSDSFPVNVKMIITDNHGKEIGYFLATKGE